MEQLEQMAIKAPYLPKSKDQEFFNKKAIEFSIVPQKAVSNVMNNQAAFAGFESRV